ncbi:MAG: hypothetical protein WCH75_13595 [Candidatus Binatia bacterium]|jgi:hypothetical protein
MVDLTTPYQGWTMIGRRFYRLPGPLSILSIFLTGIIGFVTPLGAASLNSEKDFSELRLIEVKPPFKAPDFALKEIRGKVLRLGTFPNNPLMLYFWASW